MPVNKTVSHQSPGITTAPVDHLLEKIESIAGISQAVKRISNSGEELAKKYEKLEAELQKYGMNEQIRSELVQIGHAFLKIHKELINIIDFITSENITGAAG